MVLPLADHLKSRHCLTSHIQPTSPPYTHTPSSGPRHPKNLSLQPSSASLGHPQSPAIPSGRRPSTIVELPLHTRGSEPFIFLPRPAIVSNSSPLLSNATHFLFFFPSFSFSSCFQLLSPIFLLPFYHCPFLHLTHSSFPFFFSSL